MALPKFTQEQAMGKLEYRILRADEPIVVKADQVLVETGVIWLTQSGCHEDIVLFRDQSHRPQAKGRVVIEAMGGNARVILCREPRSFLGLSLLRGARRVSTA